MVQKGPPPELAAALLARVQRVRREWERGEITDEDVRRVVDDVDWILEGSKKMNVSASYRDLRSEILEGVRHG
jgi:hypothetical protein